MRLLENKHLLKSKIVATVGKKRARMVKDEEGREYRDVIHDQEARLVDHEVDYGELLSWLILEGADVIRLNMSFAEQEGRPYGEDAKEVLKWLAEHKNGIARWVVVLGDLPGPKIRLGLDGEITLREGNEFFLDFVETGRMSGHRGANVLINNGPFCDPATEATVDGEPNIDKYIAAKKARNEKVIFFIGDGQVQLEALDSENGVVRCVVLKGGKISGKPGFTIKKADVDVKPFLGEDEKALDFLLEYGGGVVAYVGVSFVNGPGDIINIKRHAEKYFFEEYAKERLTQKYGEDAAHKGVGDLEAEEIDKLRAAARRSAPHIIAKFETKKACEGDSIDRILDVADGAMVARGDLGLQLDPQEVPARQKRIIRTCNLRGKPVITATQMLDSMENNIEPTRAEASDVFNAIQDGTDAVMLSGETSKGKYPAQAVRMMAQIAEEAEQFYMSRFSGKAYERRLQIVMDESDELSKETFKRLTVSAEKSAAKYFMARGERDPALEETKRWEAEWYREKCNRSAKQKITDRISESACLLSEARDIIADDNAPEGGEYKAILAPTTSGRTARMIARFRPNVPIIGAAHDETNAREMILSFGVYPLCIGSGQPSMEVIFNAACDEAVKKSYIPWSDEFRLLKVKDVVISTSGTPLFKVGATNLIQIKEVPEPEGDGQPAT